MSPMTPGIRAEEGQGREQRVRATLFRHRRGRGHSGDGDAPRRSLHERYVEGIEWLSVGVRDRVDELFRTLPTAVERYMQPVCYHTVCILNWVRTLRPPILGSMTDTT